MPKLKRLLVSARFETAQRLRHCFRSQEHVICQSEKCWVVKENMSKNTHCREGAALSLQKDREELNPLPLEMEKPDEAYRRASA
ncbi:MAG: hypothetical protein V1800_18340 [Candidatus Latescibacterota bacterium]